MPFDRVDRVLRIRCAGGPQIPAGTLQIGVSHEVLHRPQIDPIAEQHRRISSPELMQGPFPAFLHRSGASLTHSTIQVLSIHQPLQLPKQVHVRLVVLRTQD